MKEADLPVLCRVMSADGPHEIRRLHPLRCEVTEKLEPTGSAYMVLPEEDAADVSPGLFVRIGSAWGPLGYFRIQSTESVTDADGLSVKVELEHALCTLEDDIFFMAETRDITTDLITDAKYILEKQTVRYWQYSSAAQNAMSTIYRELTFENCTLLEALLQVGRAPAVHTVYETDFSTWPWTLSLHGLNLYASTEVRLNRNLRSCRITADRREMATRLYPLGQGEGIDQCNISSVEPEGKYYIQDDDAIAKWGIIRKIWVDTSITAPDTLYWQAKEKLESLKSPVISVEIDAADLSAVTGEPMDHFVIGRYCRVAMPDYGTELYAHIVGIRYRDLFGDPGRVTVTLSNDYLGSADRQLAGAGYRVQKAELRTRGSTSEDSMRQTQALTAGGWTDFNFFISGDIVSLNRCELNYSLTKNGVALGMRVDGQDFPLTAGVRCYDIVAALTRDTDGRVKRNAWHSLSFYTDSEYVTMVLDLKMRSYIRPTEGVSL